MLPLGKIFLLVLLILYALYLVIDMMIGNNSTKTDIADNATNNERLDDIPIIEQEHLLEIEEAKKSMSLEQRIDKSWDFLIYITEKILNFFSLEDQKTIYNAGTTLRQHGGGYLHDVDQELDHSLRKSFVQELHNEKSQENQSRNNSTR